ncbi:MAG: response regulator [Candidatus Taylorbacteria bacterium]|nr:response regulator [Candidatus Taylorbacteria bacterium]
MSSSLYNKNERILIIESDSVLGEQIKSALQKDGYDVTLVKNGVNGLKSIYDTMPHLILMDADLAGVDSYEIIELKQAEPLLAKIPLFLISNEAKPINMGRLPEGSVTEIFLALHAKPGELVKKINRQFGNMASELSSSEPSSGDVQTGKKILWVEDDKLIGTILSKKLKEAGFALFHATNGEEALKILESVIPDVVVLDLVLPNMSGFDIMEAIKKERATSHIPVMILSNLNKQSDIEKAESLGAKKFLVKASTSLDQIVEEIKALSA